MASETNNKIKQLNDVIDDDPTNELRALESVSESNAGDEGTDELNRLGAETVEREERILALQDELEASAAEIRALESRLDTEVREREAATEALAEKSRLAETLNVNLDEARARLAAQQELLAEANQRAEALTGDLQSRVLGLSRMEAEVRKLEEELQQSRSELDRSRTEVDRLSEELSTSRARNQDTESVLRTGLAKLARTGRDGRRARRELERLRRRLQRKEQTAVALERELETLREESKQLRNERRIERSRDTSTRSAESGHDGAPRTPREEALQVQLEESRQRIAVLAQETEEQQKRIRRLRADRREQTDGEEKPAAEEVDTLTDTGQTEHADGIGGADEPEESNQELRQLWEELSERTRELDRARSRLARMETRLAEVKSDLAQRDEFAKEHAASLEETRAEIREFQRELSEALNRNAALHEGLQARDEIILALRQSSEQDVPEAFASDPDAAEDHAESETNAGRSHALRLSRSLIAMVNGRDLRYPLFKERLTIGRTAGNDIQLKTPFVSRSHAAIINEADRVHIVDLGSKNGIFINGDREARADLHHGDRLKIGDTEFLYEEHPRD